MTSRIKLPFKLGDSKKPNESEINETIRKEDFSLSEIVCYGFPYRPTTLAYDPVQKILAIGTKNGIIKIYGGAFVECSLPHPSEVEIVQLIFRINEGALISACRDNCIHLWSLRQKKPVIANTLRFAKERISRCLLPLAFNSKWLLVGTYSGNVYVVNLDTFTLSSYKIMWNNAIGMGKNTHPGAVIDLCQNPDDPTRLYIGFSTHLTAPSNSSLGHVICWNLQQKTSESVYTLQHGLTSISWHHEGRQFMCSHCDGSLSVWNLRATDKPVSINYPHARIAKEETHRFGSINKVMWSTVKSSGEAFIIFSGGMPPQNDQQQSTANNATTTASPPPKPSSYFLTILRGQTTNVLHMDNSIIDFHIITPSPHIADIPDPSAVVVLLENDLVVIDLKSENYPLFESLHTLDLHESPVTFCDYITEPNTNFYQSLLRLQSKQTPKRTFSQQENPISGGRSGSTIFGYNELILTGHADGSIKFWDASGCNLLFLYKLRTNRLFDRVHTTNPSSSSSANRDVNASNKYDTRSNRANSNPPDDHLQQQMNSLTINNETNPHEYPYAIYAIKLCCEGKYLTAAARGGHVTLFKFTGSELEKADEGLGDLTCLEVPILHRNLSNDHDELSSSGNTASSNEGPSRSISDKKDFKSLLRAKMGYRRMAGYQPELVCLLSWLPSDKTPFLTDISINSKYGLLVFGLDNGLVVVDFLSQSILMNMATADLYGTMDPFQRTTASPKRRGPTNDLNNDDSTNPDYQQAICTSNQQSNDPGSLSSHCSHSHVNQNASRSHSKSSHTSSHHASNESVPPNFFRSRSIDSVSMEKSDVLHGSSSGGNNHNQEEKSTTLVKTLRTLRKRLSRTSYSVKHENPFKNPHLLQVEKDHSGKEGDDETDGSSGTEDTGQLNFASTLPTADLEFAGITSPPPPPPPPPTSTTSAHLRCNRSLPVDQTPRIVTSPPFENLNDSNEKNNDSTSSNENASLSKTWSSSIFTGAQLRGTCSLEYAEYMRDKAHRRKAHMIDLRKDDPFSQPFQQRLTATPSLVTNKSSGVDLPRSSSNSSMDNIISNESVCAIQFSESFTYKNDNTVSPSIWLGTSTGCVLVINLNIIYEPRNISVVPSGSVFRLCGRLLSISFLDHKGAIIPPPSEKWDTKKLKSNRSNDTFAQPPDLNSSTVIPGSGILSSSAAATAVASTTTSSNIQYAVFCSSKQARVVSLPSQVCSAKQKIDESLGASASQFLRAAVVKVAGSACLTCFQSGNRIQVFSLPSLRQLYAINLENTIDSLRPLIASTFTFTNRGHGLFMCSPTEIQKFTIASDVKEQINEMLCELYSPSIVMPDAPKPNFFAKIFAANNVIDHDQLFGEAAGKAPFGVAKKEDVNMNLNQLRGKADSATNVISETHMKLVERGQKLGEVDIASKQMAERAEEFASLSHKMMMKQKEKAEWSWPFASKKS